MTNQESLQSCIRAITGTALENNGDWLALFDIYNIPQGTFNERMAKWLQSSLNTTRDNINELKAQYAIYSGFNGWSELNCLSALPGLTLWLDAQSIGLGAASAWTDKSGNGNNAVQANGANQPVNTANQINGKPALIFDGTNDYLATNAFTGGNLTTSTIFIVAKRAVSGVGSAGMYLVDGIDGTNRQAILSADATQYYLQYGGDVLTSSTVASVLPHVHCAVFNGASSNYYVDGVSVISGNAGSNQLAGLTIGARYSTSNFFNGSMAEVITFNRALSNTERLLINQYLDNKWGTPTYLVDSSGNRLIDSNGNYIIGL